MAGKKKNKKKGSWLANRSRKDRAEAAAPSGQVVSATDKSFKRLVLRADQPVLVDFWAPWCGPCKQVGPVVAELAREYDGRARMVKVDVDENPKLSAQYNIRSIPTLMVFAEGDVVQTLVGAQGKRELTQALDQAVA